MFRATRGVGMRRRFATHSSMSRASTIPRLSSAARSRQQRVARQLRELMSASVAIGSARSEPELLETIAERARTVRGAEQALVDVEVSIQESRRWSSKGARDGGFNLERDGAQLTTLARSSPHPVRLHRNELRSGRWLPQGASIMSAQVRGWLAAPLLTRESNIMGAIQLANKERGQFSEDDEFLLAQLAQIASVALENARLYAESQRQLAERARAEESMRLYRQIFASSSDAIAIIDPQGRYLEQNAAHRALIGYSDEELRDATPLIHLGEEAFNRVVQELLRAGEYRGELRSRARSGRLLDIDLAAFTVRKPAGEVLCHVGIKREISERKRVEDEIRARVRQQGAVVDLGRQALAGVEVAELMQHASEIVADTLGTDYCKVLELQPDGKTMLLSAGVGWKPGYVGHKTLSAGSDSHAGYTLLSSEPVIIDDLRTENRFSEALLQEHGVISGISVLIEGAERPFGVIGAHNRRHRTFTPDDVTFMNAVANVLAAAIERKRVEERLRESDRRFRQAQRSANIGAYDWDVSTGSITWSEELPVLRELGHDANFHTWLARIVPDDRAHVVEIMNDAVARGSDFDLEFRMATPKGTIWLASRGKVFREQPGGPAHVLGVVFDITARVQAGELLRRSEKLAVVGRLAATIAHEINNPLESVTNLLYLLEHHAGLDETARKYASLAQQELHRVAHIARQTLSFHRESTTSLPVRLSELLENVLRLHARRIAESNIQVETCFAFNDPVNVFPSEIQQVISNLVQNAIEATGSGGRLIIRLVPAREWRRPYRHGVRLMVCDNGPGIPADIRQQVFEPFFTTKGEKGTGLGLWVINGIVQKHNGGIRLRSRVTAGRSYTCFSIFLPVEAAIVQTVQRKQEAAAHPHEIAA